MMTMNRPTHTHRFLWHLLCDVLVLLAMTGCQNKVFTGNVECPPAEGKQLVRITTRVLNPVTPLRAANDFKPVEKDATLFESQIASLRVIGFYPEARGEHKAGDVAFNEVFVNNDLLKRDGWVAKAGVKSLQTHPTDAPGTVSVEFETELTGKLHLVLIANTPLNTIAEDNPRVNKTSSVLQIDSNDATKGSAVKYDLSKVKNIEELQQCFISTSYAYIYPVNEDPSDVSHHLSHYNGAVPAAIWGYTNGGLPMLGQGSITIAHKGPSSTGSDIIDEVNINLERVVAKLEVTITNADEQGKRYPDTRGLHLHSIRFNNYPMYAMLLPSQRGATKDYATPGVTHHYYSTAEGNRFMDMYRAEEKTLTVGGEKVIPLEPKGYDAGATLENNEKTNFKPAYNLFVYYTDENATDRFAKLDWRYFTRPDAVIKRDQSVYYINSPGQEVLIPERAGIDYRPLELYMLPTTNDLMPDVANKISTANGKADMKHAPAELIVSIAHYSGTIDTSNPVWEYIVDKDRVIGDYHFILENKDQTKTDDRYAIRRNTIYRYNLVWEGKQIYFVDDGIKVLPWKVENETIEVDIDDAVTPPVIP